jgi:hypothetical protein
MIGPAIEISNKEIYRRYRAFLDEIQPLIKLKMDIMNCASPGFTIYPDGKIIRAPYPEIIEARLKQIEDLIGIIKFKYSLF